MATVLIVDDEPDNLSVLKWVVGHGVAGCTVATAQSAEEGLALAAEQSIDCALIDVQMPGSNGLDMCRRLKAGGATTPFPITLITSHRSTPQLRAEGLDAGVMDFISRPIDNIELVAKIRAMLRIKQAEDKLRSVNAHLEELVERRTKALRQSLQASADIARAIPVGLLILTHDPSGRLMFLEGNPEAERLLKGAMDAPPNTDLVDVWPHQSAHILSQTCLDVIETGISVELTDIPCEIAGAGRTFRVTVFGIPSDRVGIAFEDVTEQKEAEEARAQLEDRLRQAQKMEAIGTLAGGIAHDFNNILAAILGYTELALGEAPDTGTIKSSLQEVMEAGYRAKDLVHQILTFSHHAEHERRPLQVRLIVKEVLKLLRASLPATIEIRPQLQAESAFVLADPTEIHQIIMNLATNAYHAMRDGGGVLEIGLSSVELDAQAIPAMPELREGRYVRLTIRDTGQGMDAATLERAFKPFFSTKEVGEGTGLGLSIVHGIVTDCGGAIQVLSEPGQGTSFHVYLPQVTATPQAKVLPERSFPGGNERVLLVDDEEPITRCGKYFLQSHGYTVTALTSSVEALDMFRLHPERFDLVVTDETMPKLTGSELAKELLAIRHDLPIVLCSGMIKDSVAEEVKKNGVREYLSKPFTSLQLGEAIRRALDVNTVSPSDSQRQTA